MGSEATTARIPADPGSRSPLTEGRCARWTTNTKAARHPRRNDPRLGLKGPSGILDSYRHTKFYRKKSKDPGSGSPASLGGGPWVGVTGVTWFSQNRSWKGTTGFHSADARQPLRPSKILVSSSDFRLAVATEPPINVTVPVVPNTKMNADVAPGFTLSGAAASATESPKFNAVEIPKTLHQIVSERLSLS